MRKAAKAKAKAAAAPSNEPQPKAPEDEPKAMEEDTKPTKAAPKPPGEAARKSAMKALMEAKADDAAWHHVLRLFKAMEAPEVTRENQHETLEKRQHWSLSMYWDSKRIGLLQKRPSGKGAAHVLSFGGGHCLHIGLPLEAIRMYAGHQVVFLLSAVHGTSTGKHMGIQPGRLCLGSTPSQLVLPPSPQVEFVGGDKPKDELKPVDDPCVLGYKQALQDLVKAVGVAHFLGKTPESFSG